MKAARTLLALVVLCATSACAHALDDPAGAAAGLRTRYAELRAQLADTPSHPPRALSS